MMNFVLLATGHETVLLIQAVTRSPEHRLVAFVADGPLATQVLQLAPAARRLTLAAEVLNIRDVDAAIIASNADETLEVAKQLAGNSVAILLYPRAAHGIEFIYQLGLIRDEQPDVFRLYPIRPWRLHPLAIRLRQALERNELGRVHQLQWVRDLHVDSSAAQPLLTKPQVEGALLTDVDLLKFLAGEFDQVTALQTGNPEQGILQASLNLIGPGAAPTVWSCRGTHGPSTWRLTVTGDKGTLALHGGEDQSRMTWEAGLGAAHEIPATPADTVTFDYGPAVLQEFLEGNATVAATNVWADDLNRIFDLLEGVHRSLRRRRTVELYFDTPSERSNFKTQMTAIGCGVLLLTLLAIVGGLGAGLVAHELNLPPIIMQAIRVLVFAPLFVFLFLQVGIFLSKPSAGTKTS